VLGIRQSWGAAQTRGHRGSSLRATAAYALRRRRRWWWRRYIRCRCSNDWPSRSHKSRTKSRPRRLQHTWVNWLQFKSLPDRLAARLLAHCLPSLHPSCWRCHDTGSPLLAAKHSLCRVRQSGTICLMTFVHSRTTCPSNGAWKYGCSLVTSVQSILETMWQCAIQIHFYYYHYHPIRLRQTILLLHLTNCVKLHTSQYPVQSYHRL